MLHNKKGSAWGWFVGIGFIIIGLGLLVTLLIISNQTTQEEEQKEKVMSVYLSSKDIDLKKSTTIDYQVYSNLTGELISKGQIERNSFTEIKNISNLDNLTIYCGGQGYYHEIINKHFTIKEISDNLSKVECGVSKIGKLTANTDNKLQEGQQVINIKLNSESNTRQLSFCVAWTSGIKTLSANYNETEKPERIEKIVDKCYNTGINLNDNSTNILINIKSESIDTEDKLTFYFFDKDLVLNQGYLSELNENLGSNKDLIFEVKNE